MIRAAVDEPENLRDVVMRLSENLHGVQQWQQLAPHAVQVFVQADHHVA
jgi:hypothetical protein